MPDDTDKPCEELHPPWDVPHLHVWLPTGEYAYSISHNLQVVKPAETSTEEES